jgi:phosphatidylethanolamine/phosphatidyl-N-methylethanolamine N-methyltransferase
LIRRFQSISHVTNQLSGPFIFMRSLLRNPLAVGALAPSSPQLCRLIASRVDWASSHVLEVGAGTGSITDALLNRGVPPHQLLVIERDPTLVSYLRERFPHVRIRCGDAVHAGAILRDEGFARVPTLISSLPIRNLKGRERIAVVRGMMNALAPDGQLIQFTYAASCPIPSARLGLKAECLGRVWMNIPPAAVWRFTRSQWAGQAPGLSSPASTSRRLP